MRSAPRRVFPSTHPLLLLFLVALLVLPGCSATGLELFPIQHDASVGYPTTPDASPGDGSPVTPPWGEGGAVDAQSASDSSNDDNDAGGGIQASPPPWEIDGGYEPDAACPGRLLKNGECLVTLASGQASPWGIAIDTESVYFANGGTYPGANDGTIAKVGRFGGDVVTLASGVSSFHGTAHGIAVDAKSVYWDGDSIMSTGLDGGTPITIFNDDNSQTLYVTRAGARIYWANSQFDFGVRSASLDGSQHVQITPYIVISGLTASSTGIVWSQVADPHGSTAIISEDFAGTSTSLYGGENGLVKCAGNTLVFLAGEYGLDGMLSLPLTGGSPMLLTKVMRVTEFVTDGAHVYWMDAGAILKLSLATGAQAVLASAADEPAIAGTGSLTIDSSSIYFTEQAGEVFKLFPR
jgi:hypothetical protein